MAETLHPKDGWVREIDQLVRVSDASVVVHRIAPELGQHTDAVLRSAGCSDAQIDDLRARGAVR